MFGIIVTEKGGDQRRLEFDKSEVTIGRVQGNDIILPKGNVSKRHARIVLKDGKFIIVDLKSTNGTYVNGRKITSPLVVKASDKIYIGDFILGVEEAGAQAPAFEPPPPEPPAPPPPPAPAPPPMEARPAPPPMEPRPAPPEPVRAPPPAPRPAPRPPAPEPPPDMLDAGPAPMAGPGPGAPPPGRPAPKPRLVGAGAARAQSASPAPVPSPAPAPSAPAPSPVPPTPVVAPRAAPKPPRAPARASAPPPLAGHGVHIEPLPERVRETLEVQNAILERVVARLDLDNVPLDRLGEEELWQRTESAIVDLVETMDSSGELPGNIDQDTLIKESLNEALGLGPLEDLLADEDIDEIIVDRRDRIIVEKNGTFTGAGTAFSSDDAFLRVVERLVAPTGHVIDEDHPLVDTRLRDGSRLAAAVPPVAVRGACLTLRKPKQRGFSLAELIDAGTVSPAMADFLSTCVVARKNILVCGAPHSGKSSVVAALASTSPEGERVVSVEEVAELAIDREDWIALEARPVAQNGAIPVDLASVLRGALRMRPDRLVVGDVRSGAALELVSAMASSADGTIASVAGDGAAAALGRLTSMARLDAPGASVDAMRELTAAAVDVVVHVARYVDGVYRVASVAEVRGATAEGFDLQELFCFRGAADGGFAAAGVIPGFYAELEARGMPADTSIFRT